MDSEPKDMEGQLYSKQVLPIKSRWPSCFGELSSADLVRVWKPQGFFSHTVPPHILCFTIRGIPLKYWGFGSGPRQLSKSHEFFDVPTHIKVMLKLYGSLLSAIALCLKKYTYVNLKIRYWDFLVVQWLRLCIPNAGNKGLIPRQGTRSHMPQLRVHMLQLKILHATVKIKDPMCCS